MCCRMVGRFACLFVISDSFQTVREKEWEREHTSATFRWILSNFGFGFLLKISQNSLIFADMLLNYWVWSSADVWKYCWSRKMLQHEYLITKSSSIQPRTSPVKLASVATFVKARVFQSPKFQWQMTQVHAQRHAPARLPAARPAEGLSPPSRTSS